MTSKLPELDLEGLRYHACSSGTSTQPMVRDQILAACAEIDRLRVLVATPQPSQQTRDARQRAIYAWARAAFGDAEATVPAQRAVRLLEEAIELYQACGGDVAMARELVDFVFKRPPGQIGQEIGGVSVCVLALAAAVGLSADEEERREIDRVLDKPVEEFSQRNAAKNAAGFLATRPQLAGNLIEAAQAAGWGIKRSSRAGDDAEADRWTEPARVMRQAPTVTEACPETATDFDGIVVPCIFQAGHAQPHRFIRIDPNPVNVCGICGEEFKISKGDPHRELIDRHLSTGHGPICPREVAEVKLCNIPARTLPPCDLEWGHDGDMHGNMGDGFYAREYDDVHHKRQAMRAKVPPK